MEQEYYWRKVIRITGLFKSYFAGELNDREKEMIENWRPDRDANAPQKTVLSPKIVERRGMRVKKKVFNRLDIHYPEETSYMIRKLTRVPYLIKYASVAAIVTIVVGVSYVMLNSGSVKEQYILAANERQRLEQTGDSQTKEIELPDGTKIHMNCNSGIEYIQKEFNREKREIWLEGEAYFDVTKQPDRPFIIHSKDITTTVHGTSFNIKAYDSIGEISITVKTGKVEISSGPSVLGLLTPNKQLIYRNETQTHAIANRNWDDVSAWMEKRLVLCDANVNELKIRLKQIYGIEIIVENNALSNSVLNASYPAGTKINSVLQGIGEIYNINYAIDEKKKTARIY